MGGKIKIYGPADLIEQLFAKGVFLDIGDNQVTIDMDHVQFVGVYNDSTAFTIVDEDEDELVEPVQIRLVQAA